MGREKPPSYLAVNPVSYDNDNNGTARFAYGCNSGMNAMGVTKRDCLFWVGRGLRPTVEEGTHWYSKPDQQLVALKTTGPTVTILFMGQCSNGHLNAYPFTKTSAALTLHQRSFSCSSW